MFTKFLLQFIYQIVLDINDFQKKLPNSP